ncbi:MAG: sulfotransferase domain-containing protein, partial [Bacteroidales bacterium]|nr:sulfotransferase domain-containing protein [Bacteroidales bacterium]
RFNASVERFEMLKEKLERKGTFNPQQAEKFSELEQQFKFKAMKSHELPVKTLPSCEENPFIIYLVRDGRDALVSTAHHRKDIVKPGSDFKKNLKEAIKAKMGTYFGGWGYNVEEWLKIAHVVFRFEDFIKNPVEHTEKLRQFISLPEPDLNKVPTFESQKSGEAHFGGQARQKLSEQEQQEFNNKFFRKGKVGGWKDDMPEDIHDLFWKKYEGTMEKLGYRYDGSIADKIPGDITS